MEPLQRRPNLIRFVLYPAANEEEVAALNIVETFTAGQNIQVYWASDNINMTLASLASTMGGPAIPSVIVTVVPVGA